MRECVSECVGLKLFFITHKLTGTAPGVRSGGGIGGGFYDDGEKEQLEVADSQVSLRVE